MVRWRLPRTNEYAVVIALSALAVVIGWRVMVLVGSEERRASQAQPPDAVRSAGAADYYLIYSTYQVVDRGARDWANDDKLVYSFKRYPLGGGRSETVAEIVEDNAKAYGAPWMRPLSDEVLLFMRRHTGSEDFVWIDASGRELDRPVPPSGSGIDGLPSPEGGRVAYVDPVRKTVSVVTLGSLLQTFDVESGAEVGFWSPLAWTPDGRKLYLKPVFEGGGFVSGLWVIDLDEAESSEIEAVGRLGLVDISIDTVLGKLVGATFEGDGYGADFTGPSSIYLIDLETGQDQVILTDRSLAMRNPLLSPDGRRIAFSFAGGDPDIWVIDVATGKSSLFLSGTALAWTPDGRALIVSRDDELQIAGLNGEGMTTIARRTGKYQDPDFQGLEFIGIVKGKSQ